MSKPSVVRYYKPNRLRVVRVKPRGPEQPRGKKGDRKGRPGTARRRTLTKRAAKKARGKN